MNRYRLWCAAAALAILALVPNTALAQVPRFDSLYVFGDSLADTGNVFVESRLLGEQPAVPPSDQPFQAYFKGRFSNGYIGVEYLWQRLTGYAPGSSNGMKAFLTAPVLRASGAVSFAFGGTGTPVLDQTPGGGWAPGLKGQVEIFRAALPGKTPSKKALYVIITGFNDYRDDPYNVPMDPADVVKGIADSVARLYQTGARHVMVVNLPDLGVVPAFSGNPGPASQLSDVHNGLLTVELNKVRSRFPPLHLVQVDLDPLIDGLVQTLESRVPALEVFSAPGQSACIFINPALCQDALPFTFDNPALGFVFWDVVHPTAQAHRELGNYLYDTLTESS